MTSYQIYTRLKHILLAKHWRGHGVHSPMMYDFIREVVMRTPRKGLVSAIVKRYGGAGGVAVVGSMAELERMDTRVDVMLFGEPFCTKQEYRQFMAWYRENHVVVAHLQGVVVLFFDPKLKKQFYSIRS